MATPIPQAAPGAGETNEELQRLVQGMREALTDTMVERLATTAGAALEVVVDLVPLCDTSCDGLL